MLIFSKRRVIITTAIILGIAVVGVVFLWFKGLAPFDRRNKAGLEVTTSQPLGEDAPSVLANAARLREKADYTVVYDIKTSSSIPGAAEQNLRRVEMKYGDLERVDMYVSAVLASRYISNKQGKYGCFYTFGESVPSCFNVTQALKDVSSKNYAASVKANTAQLQKLVEAGVASTRVVHQTKNIGNKERACDEVIADSPPGALVTAGLEAWQKILGITVVAEESKEVSDMLKDFTMRSSVCFDRETGLPLSDTQWFAFGPTEFVTGEIARSVTSGFAYLDGVDAKKIISKEDGGYDAIQTAAFGGDVLYVAGDHGVYSVKNGALVKHDAEINRETGDIYSAVYFDGKLFVSGRTGLSYENGSWHEELTFKQTMFGVYQYKIWNGKLYAATGRGVFVRENGAWVQPNDSYKAMKQLYGFTEAGGVLFARGDKVFYKFENGEWQEFGSVPESVTRKVISSGGRIFMTVNSRAGYEIIPGLATLVAEFKQIGVPEDMATFRTDVVIAGERGVYSANSQYVASADVVGNASDLEKFDGELYVAADNGVYQLSKHGWSITGDQSGVFDAVALHAFDGALWAGGTLGVYRLEKGQWLGSEDMGSVGALFSDGKRLYAVTQDKKELYEISSRFGNPEDAFALPKDAKLLNPSTTMRATPAVTAGLRNMFGVRTAQAKGRVCGYCGTYFIFGDPKPFSECMDRVLACKGDSRCQCAAERDLGKKYDDAWRAQKMVAEVGGMFGTPGAGLIDPDKRQRIINGEAGVGEVVSDVFGSLAPKPVKAAAAVADALTQTNQPAWQRVATAASGVLSGNAKVAADAAVAVGKLRDLGKAGSPGSAPAQSPSSASGGSSGSHLSPNSSVSVLIKTIEYKGVPIDDSSVWNDILNEGKEYNASDNQPPPEAALE